MVQINENRLLEIADSSATAHDFFDYAAKRTRNVRDGISRIVQVREQMRTEGYNAVPQDLLAVFKELQSAGVGSLNDKGNFKWNLPIKEVGKMVQKTGIKPSSKEKSEPAFKITSYPTEQKKLVLILGPDKEVRVNFTGNLTRNDIELIATKMLQECTS